MKQCLGHCFIIILKGGFFHNYLRKKPQMLYLALFLHTSYVAPSHWLIEK